MVKLKKWSSLQKSVGEFMPKSSMTSTHGLKFSIAPLKGRHQPLPSNFRLGWEDFSGTNTLAYLDSGGRAE